MGMTLMCSWSSPWHSALAHTGLDDHGRGTSADGVSGGDRHRANDGVQVTNATGAWAGAVFSDDDRAATTYTISTRDWGRFSSTGNRNEVTLTLLDQYGDTYRRDVHDQLSVRAHSQVAVALGARLRSWVRECGQQRQSPNRLYKPGPSDVRSEAVSITDSVIMFSRPLDQRRPSAVVCLPAVTAEPDDAHDLLGRARLSRNRQPRQCLWPIRRLAASLSRTDPDRGS